MTDIDLIKNGNNSLDIKRVKIKDVSHVDDYLYIIFDNGQKIVTNEKEIYDVTEFGYIQRIFNMGDRLCAIVINGYNPCLLDLKTKEILFDDMNAYSISKQDERTLHVIMKSSDGNNIYDIERKCYLPMPDGYEFENSLGNGLYVFCEKNLDIAFYDKKRCVIDVKGFFFLNNVQGWIYLEDNYFIVHKDKQLSVFEFDYNVGVKSFKTIEKNDEVLTTPEYYDGKIIIVLEDVINIYKPNLELIKSISVPGLKKVTSSERIGDVLKLCVPTIYNGEENGRHIFVNVETGKIIEHLRINGYPYWSQDVFVGQDELDLTGYDSLVMDFYFYDKDFKLITVVKGSYCVSAEDEKESLFIVGDGHKKILVNTSNGCTKEVDYTLVKYHFSAPYGYGVHQDNKTMDFFDENLDVIIPNFEFEKYDLNFNMGGFSYFIVNGYVCIITDFVDACGKYRYRKIIYSSDGETILDSYKHKCFPIGNFIQIMDEKSKDSIFLNTLSGEIGELSLSVPVDSTGRIDFSKLKSISRQLVINDRPAMLEDGDAIKKKVFIPLKGNE